MLSIRSFRGLRNFFLIGDRQLVSTRGSHTDIKVPDFPKYQRKPPGRSNEAKEDSKAAHGILLGLNFVAALYSAKTIAQIVVKTMAISADVQALAQIEINLDEIPEGGHTTIKWRGKPLFLKHRLPDEIQASRATPVSSLRDPATDEQRCPNPEWLVVIGVCTHLGCVPIPNAGDYLGGYYCPCHGSHYDAAGRIRKGPAPTNLEIPVHEFKSDNKLVVG